MTEKRQRSRRARLFVALELPDRVREEVGRWGREQLRDPALRPAPAASLHLTLAFLGYRPEGEIEAISAAVGEAVGPAPWVELLDPVQRPARGRARLYALPVLSPGAESLQAGLAGRLIDAGFYAADKRRFWPHVTVARVRGEGRGSRRPARVETGPGKLPDGLREPFIGVRMTLYRSELQPSGASYVSLAQVELPGGGRQ
jgi:2'-5' RNA ligase